MTGLPDWLPPMLKVDPWGQYTFGLLYSVFERDFKQTPPRFKGAPIWFFPEMDDEREKIFWHLTHREERETGERLPDLRRCERLPWIKAIIENHDQQEVLSWDYKEGDGSIKTYVWLEHFDFVVIMKKYRDGGRRLVTSFYVDYAHERKKLRKKYEKRIELELERPTLNVGPTPSTRGR